MSAIKRLLGLLVIGVLIVGGLGLLQDATEYEGGVDSESGQTEVIFDVATNGFGHSKEYAAKVLWHTCVGTITDWTEVDEPVPQADSYVASVRPALVEETRRRLKGCLIDSTIDNVLGDVDRIYNTPAR